MPHPDSQPTPQAHEAMQSEKLRHFRHLLADEHFLYFLGALDRDVERERAAALDETALPKDRRRSLARYHMAREIAEMVPSLEKTLTASAGRGPT